MAVDLDDSIFEGTKEILAVSSITNEIKSSVHSYLLAASPRSATAASPVTPNNQVRKYPGILSPWNGCIGTSIDSYSPQSVSVTPLGSSPELYPGIILPQSTSLRYPMHCSLSPTRNRFHSPKASAAGDSSASSSFIFDLKSIPDLEQDVGRTSPATSASSHSFHEAHVQVETLNSIPAQALFGTATGSLPERLNFLQGFQVSYSGSKPPRPPRQGKKLSLKGDSFGWRSKGKFHPSAMQECADNMTISVISFLLLVLFMVLVVYGGPLK